MRNRLSELEIVVAKQHDIIERLEQRNEDRWIEMKRELQELVQQSSQRKTEMVELNEELDFETGTVLKQPTVSSKHIRYNHFFH